MQTSLFVSTHELSPGAARVAATRLLSWMPVGPLAVLGGQISAITRALVSLGVPLAKEREPSQAASAAIVVSHRSEGIEEASAHLSALLGEFEGPVCLIIAGGAATAGSRAFWERAMIVLDWRKHPLNERLAPYGELDRAVGLQLVGFERISEQARAVYPLRALVEERDLHTDMTREPGRRSDAHMTRYAHAAQFVRTGDRVVDVACGLGYGSYQIACCSRASSFVGLDASEYAVNYAQLNFAANSAAPMKFLLGDAQHLREMQDGSADFAVSVETLEHLPKPDLLLAELHRVLTPGGRVYASVPNDWSDETGEDPNPFHFHVYDWRRLRAQFHRNGFEIERAWLQDAGGGQKRHLAARSMLEVDSEHGPPCDGEWLLVLARKMGGGEDLAPLDRLRESLRLGAADVVADLLKVIEETASQLEVALAHAMHGWTLLASASEGAIEVWRKALESARKSFGDRGDEVVAAGILALATDVLDELGCGPVAAGTLGRLRASHAGIFELMLEHGTPWPEADDRAVVAGGSEGDEVVGIDGRALRSLMGAKDWLDAKYHEHLGSIAQLEAQVAELERARRWLDEQYHGLSAEVARLSGSTGQ